ncbi:cytochrome b/b6 domain-containing protein [Variovorax sp. J22R133]|uniref:cytochrome b/b6 domain-containing protein n=1 Tax=Variovorax brevis TaxID=3053503 RepID=UPI0025763DFD|nr:cytochrome b/b6 domain-containing protein [Variovorax sp. J22R133]MDM0115607.1 cytochrome b/b6 domain-containing protein [Variovorax sp. J22R133]
MSDPSALPTGFADLEAAPTLRIRVWDLPTRLFHWTLAAAVISQVVTGSAGIMEWHFRVGHLVLALLVFRVIWGFIGGRWSRFAAFIYAPSSLSAYLRGQSHPDHLVGHTPLGALSVFALLGLLILQVATGLVSDDEIASSGPLTRFVSNATVSLASGWHSQVGKWIILALVCMHVAAVLFYVLVRRHRLVRPMVLGDKLVSHRAMPSRDDTASRMVALMVFAVCAGFSYWIASLRV